MNGHPNMNCHPELNCHFDRSAEGAQRRACPELAEGNLQFKRTPRGHTFGFSVALAFG